MCIKKESTVLSLPQPLSDFIANASDDGKLCECEPEEIHSRVIIAIIARYGEPGQPGSQAIRTFGEHFKALSKAAELGSDNPSFNERLDALKVSVGEENYKALLANPSLERIARNNYEDASQQKVDTLMNQASALLNNAVSAEEVACFLEECSRSEA